MTAKRIRYETSAEYFSKIPGCPIAYRATPVIFSAYKNAQTLEKVCSPKQGLITGNVNQFVRKWHECSIINTYLFTNQSKANSNYRWFPYCNGGEYRKWYGNNDDVVNWYNDGSEVKNFTDDNGKQRSRPQNQQFYFCEGGTWTAISSGSFSIRYFPKGYLFSNAGMAIFVSHEKLLYIIGFLNSPLSQLFLHTLNESLNYNQGDIARLPIVDAGEMQSSVNSKVEKLISTSKEEWDSFETSWDFKKHPLI